MRVNDVFHIDKSDRACCYYCQKEGVHTDYGHGEVFLTNPGHSPCDGNANYICRRHLDDDAVVYEPFPEQGTSTAAQAATDKPLTRCASARDGDCTHKQCPQLRDNEPRATDRHCPLDISSDED